jgi:hypothetical protein
MEHPSTNAALGWGVLAAVSVTVMAVAFIVPESLSTALASIGLAGLFVVRLAALASRRTPRIWGRPSTGSSGWRQGSRWRRNMDCASPTRTVPPEAKGQRLELAHGRCG